MRTVLGKSVAYCLAYLFLFSLTVPAMAWPPPCPDCYEWNGSDCVWACGSGSCCGGSCCSNTCCNGTCCGAGQNCCGGECCSNECCNGVCCSAGQICCNGTCTPKCEDGEPTGECDTSHNAEYECVGCVLIGDCSNYTMREYYGNEVSFCNGGGCTDCLQLNAVECYVVCECEAVILWGATCETVLGHKICVTALPWNACEGCTKNPDECEPIEYRYPTRCR